MNYGDPDHQELFERVKALFPRDRMMSENLKLVRALFPLLFQFLILLLDYTLDAIDTT